MAIALALVLHAHQPAGNFDEVIEHTYRTSYLPFIEAAAQRPWLRLSLHYSGYLLDWLDRRHPDYIGCLRQLLLEQRLEILSGGYYEPILAAIPPEDQQEQIARLTQAIERLFGPAAAPTPLRRRGAWLAERVWEPDLPAVLARAGIDFTLLDDSHFQAAGLAPDDLHGYWLTEAQGCSLRLAPSNFLLRKTMPFRPVAETVDFLLHQAQAHPGSLITMGDDLEKFGSWPQTSALVYGEGWLKHFFDALETHADRVETVCIGEYMARRPARGLIYLPSASYPEMMEWAGNASWRGFLTKYREANLLHKTQWDLTHRLRREPPSPAAAEARDHILAAEANDVYWHGWFGGLYTPHLRNAAFTRLLQADAALAQAAPPGPRRFDLHGDGTEVVELRTPQLRALVTPSDGGTIEELDFLPAAANCVNSIERRPEAYHPALRQHAAHHAANLNAALPAQSPHALSAGEARRLEALLVYDRYPRSCGRLYLCPAGQPLPAASDVFQRAADPAAASSPYALLGATPTQIELAAAGVRKIYRLAPDRLELDLALAPGADPAPVPVLEFIFNLLAPDSPDRHLEHDGIRRPLSWSGLLPPSPLALWDGWRRFGLRLEAPGAAAWQVEPLYSISQSEQGFEAVYQGSALRAVWPAGARQLRAAVIFFL